MHYSIAGKLCELSGDGESDACQENPCDNFATCIPLLDDQYFCSCTPGYHGDKCQLASQFSVFTLIDL